MPSGQHGARQKLTQRFAKLVALSCGGQRGLLEDGSHNPNSFRRRNSHGTRLLRGLSKLSAEH